MNLKFYLNRRGIALFAMLVLTLIQVSVFLSFSTDNNGDPNAYVHIAKTIFKEKFEFRSFRFVGYPLFLKISTLNVSNINLLFLIQSCLFLSAVYFFGRAVTKTFLGFVIVVVPGIVPSIAYLSKLPFPDCLILSLILFLLGNVIKKNYK